jgi:hypothetical protein
VKLKVNLMKQNKRILLMVLALASPLPVLAETPGDAAVTESAAAAPEPAQQQFAGHEQGMRHPGKCKHKGKKGMHGGGHHDKHAQVVQRLDMIEARMAKIELMLESLMKRR